MSRRLVALSVLLAVALGAVAIAVDGVDTTRAADGKQWTVELLSAQGLSKGSDARIGTVRAGRIEAIELDPRTRKAKVDIVLTQPGFDELKADAFCQVRPQQLIGEYFLDCQPGTSSKPLPNRIVPSGQTAGSLGFDLLNSVLRRPSAERFRLIFAELGIGVAARGEEINETIRRAVPAIRDTNKVLRTLAVQNQVIADLVSDADRALGPAARRTGDIVDFVKETGDTAAASADRKSELAGQFREFPAFLREAVPTMRALGATADAQSGAFSRLAAGAPQLERLFESTTSFTRALVPATRALAKTSRNGRQVVRDARPTVAELTRATKDLPELGGNLAAVFEHLDDRENAVEPNIKSPTGKGFTGFEAILQFVRNQALAINIYDADGYKLKSTGVKDRFGCTTLGVAADAKARPECVNWLGPNQVGITTPDPSGAAKARRTADEAGVTREAVKRADAPRRGPDASPSSADGPDAPPASEPGRAGPLRLPDLGGAELPGAPAAPDVPLTGAQQSALMDFLLG